MGIMGKCSVRRARISAGLCLAWTCALERENVWEGGARAMMVLEGRTVRWCAAISAGNAREEKKAAMHAMKEVI